jgi:thiamine biosynthesis lipoprotein
MGTVFEILCVHPDREYARQATCAAFDLVDRLEQGLSRFIENSDISRINNLAAGQSVRISRSTMECLLMSQRAFTQTSGFFDISLGTGLHGLDLVPQDFVVHAAENGIRLDLGGIGKGYAVDRAAEVLIDWDIHQALLHGGRSSVLALEPPTGWAGWPVSITQPGAPASEPFAVLQVARKALSASGLQKTGHILNPKNRKPGGIRPAAWVVADVAALAPFCQGGPAVGRCGTPMSESAAAVAEVFSTAFLMLSRNDVQCCCRRYPGLEAWLIEGDPSNTVVHLTSGKEAL